MDLNLICYKCGASSKDKKFVDYLCIDCFINERKKRIPDELSIKICKICGKMKVSTWTRDIEKIKEELTKKFSKYNPISINIKEDEVIITFFDNVEFDKNIKIRREYTLCEVCSKVRNKYYEAIIQIRKKEEKVKETKMKIEEEKLEEIKDEVIKLLKNKTFITKIEKLKFGYNIYVGSAKDILPLISKLKIPLKITRKLYGESAGKKIYRTTFLLRV
jgi:nonsense-mediated mRNA decay protein 3